MAYVINKAAHPLPLKLAARTEEQIDKVKGLQERAHLKRYDRDRDIRPLNLAERRAFEHAERETKLSENPPMWNSITFEFEAHGKQGCLWELPLNVAKHLVSHFRGILFLVTDESEMPKGVTARSKPLPGFADLQWKGFKGRDLQHFDPIKEATEGAKDTTVQGHVSAGG